jgi:hypothetical protein
MFFSPPNVIDLRCVSGIELPIVRLVHALWCWGVEITQGKAGFYPGDHGEQEYWIQKYGLERKGIKEISGPIVMAGVICTSPYVYFCATKEEGNKLKELLTDGWKIKYHSKYDQYELVFTKLKNLRDSSSKFWQEVVMERYDYVPENNWDEIYQDADELNRRFIEAMPLTMNQFNEIRDNAINELVHNLHFDLINIPISIMKEKIEHIINKYNRKD